MQLTGLDYDLHSGIWHMFSPMKLFIVYWKVYIHRKFNKDFQQILQKHVFSTIFFRPCMLLNLGEISSLMLFACLQIALCTFEKIHDFCMPAYNMHPSSHTKVKLNLQCIKKKLFPYRPSVMQASYATHSCWIKRWFFRFFLYFTKPVGFKVKRLLQR